jgi:hypothetical protein
MPVDTPHKLYRKFCDRWALVRDTVEGEDVVKRRGDAYLPIPSGQIAENDLTKRAKYDAYKKRARFPDIVAPISRGLVGMAHRRPSKIEMPAQLEPIKEAATPQGMTLDVFDKRVTEQVCQVGRFGILVDMVENAGPNDIPKLASYQAEEIINWRTEFRNGVAVPTMVVLEEEVAAAKEDDPFEFNCDKQWRVLWLRPGRRTAADGQADPVDEAAGSDVYQQEIWQRPTAGGAPVRVKTITPLSAGKPLDWIPFVLVGSNDLTFEPDAVPLLELARATISIYMLSADYRQSLFMTSQPTPWISGSKGPDDPSTPKEIGSSTLWHLPDNARCGFLEVQGAGIEAMAKAIDAEFQRAGQIAAAVFDTTKKAAESGEALRLRQGAQSATLSGIVVSKGAGIERALRFAARWVGLDEEKVTYAPNLDFVELAVDPQFLAEVRNWVQANLLPRTMAFAMLRRLGIVDETATDEQIEAKLQTQAPALLGAALPLTPPGRQPGNSPPQPGNAPPGNAPPGNRQPGNNPPAPAAAA